MDFLLMLILNTLWIGICFACIIAGISLGIKRQKTIEPIPISEDEKKKREREERELKNFWTYNGDVQADK